MALGHGYALHLCGPSYLPFAVPPTCPMPSSATVVKCIDLVFDKDTRTWLYRDTAHEPSPLVLPGGKTPDGTDVWKDCCFMVVREVPADPDSTEEPYVVVTIKSPHLRAVCRCIIGQVANMARGSWSIDPLEVSPCSCCFRYITT